jgi:hypothetical protein
VSYPCTDFGHGDKVDLRQPTEKQKTIRFQREFYNPNSVGSCLNVSNVLCNARIPNAGTLHSSDPAELSCRNMTTNILLCHRVPALQPVKSLSSRELISLEAWTWQLYADLELYAVAS